MRRDMLNHPLQLPRTAVRFAWEELGRGGMSRSGATCNRLRRVSSPASRGRGTARRAVEGAPSAHPGQRQSHEPVRDLVEIRQDIAGGNAQTLDALRLEPFVTFRVAPRSAFDFVNPAVDLDRES